MNPLELRGLAPRSNYNSWLASPNEAPLPWNITIISSIFVLVEDKAIDQRCFPCMQRMTKLLAELFPALPSRPSSPKPRCFARSTHVLKLCVTDILATFVPSFFAAKLGVAATTPTEIKAVVEKMMHRMTCLLHVVLRFFTQSSAKSSITTAAPFYIIRKEIMPVETYRGDRLWFRGCP